ncbi:Lipase 2 [Vanrija pseudolonga]|uniref:Lipase 2 n=1 Tax=Vanrija pseudolonga TaxID=143232 RepID=A0AAF0Y272_9TREE|nr:Lipase 2 [Vanrija pseudolonga]
MRLAHPTTTTSDMRFAALLAATAALAAAANPLPRPQAYPVTATIQQGGADVQIVGFQNAGVDNYFGIPFAKPPVGDLRFAHPEPAVLTSPVNATALPNACMQKVNALTFGAPGISEDCLYLNVVTPPGASTAGGPGLPVLVYIYGGSFTEGTGATYTFPIFPNWAIQQKRPVVLVTLNYRLGIFGWGFGKEIAAHGAANLGLRDQKLALEWVRDNIKAFGGDPSKVTAFGQSAGAISVANLMYDTSSDLFRGAIMMSGAQSTLPNGPVATTWQKPYDELVASVGCANASTAGVTPPSGLTAAEEAGFQCLKKLPADQLQTAATTLKSQIQYIGAFIFGPSIDGDLIPDRATRLLAAGKFKKIPFITGNVNDEGTGGIPQSSLISGEATLNLLIRSILPLPVQQPAVDKVLKAYPDVPALGAPYGTGNNTFGLPSTWKQAASILGDAAFQSRRRAFLRTANTVGWSKTWSYLFNAPTPGDAPILGVSHGTDVFFWFGYVSPQAASLSNSNSTGLLPSGFSSADVALSQNMMSYVINFAYDLDPNGKAPAKRKRTNQKCKPTGGGTGPPAPGSNSSLPFWPQHTYPSNKNSHEFVSGNIKVIQDDYREQQMDVFFPPNQDVIDQFNWRREEGSS